MKHKISMYAIEIYWRHGGAVSVSVNEKRSNTMIADGNKRKFHDSFVKAEQHMFVCYM